MQTKDYYAELEITPDADEQTIKHAYRRLARQYHPDVNAGDPRAEERFKAVNEAYQTLGDPQKRKRYDTLRQQQQYWQHAGGVGETDWGQWQGMPGGWVYSNVVPPEDLQDLFSNPEVFSDLFGAAFGAATGNSRSSRPRREQDVEAHVEVTLEEALHGTQRTLQVGERRIEARIPPGVYTGSRIRLAGQGQVGNGSDSAGDLFLVIEVLPDARFERQGDDLMTEASVDIYTAAIGGKVRIPTLDGLIWLKIPEQTQAGKKFRLRGKGMPRLEQPEQRGDMYVSIKLVLPDALSETELETLRELARQREVA